MEENSVTYTQAAGLELGISFQCSEGCGKSSDLTFLCLKMLLKQGDHVALSWSFKALEVLLPLRQGVSKLDNMSTWPCDATENLGCVHIQSKREVHAKGYQATNI